MNPRPRVFLFVCAQTAALLVCAIVALGHRQFGGNDQGVLVDVAYRLFCGQHPYVDFPITQPILFYLGGLWALQFFGVTWSAFIYIAALFSAATFGLHILLLRRIGIPRSWAYSIATVVQAGAMVTGAYWWYNPVSDVAVLLLCTAAALVLTNPGSLTNWFLYCGCLSAASLAKPNVAGLVILASSVAIFCSGRARWRGVLFSLLAACASLALLGFYRLNPVSVVHGYLSAAGRGVPALDRFAQDQPVPLVQWSLFLVVMTLAPLAALCDRRSLLRPLGELVSCRDAALLGGVVAGVVGCFTNGELKVVDLAITLNAVALLCLLHPREASPARPLFLQKTAMTVLALTAAWLGVTRARIEAIGPFYERTTLYPIGALNPFFAQLECGPYFTTLLDQVTVAMAEASKNLGRKPKVFFGPRMGWGYAAFGLEPPPGLPYSWLAGVDYPVEDLGTYVDAFKRARFDYCFFVFNRGHADTTYMPIQLLEVFRRDYTPVVTTRRLVVIKRKPG